MGCGWHNYSLFCRPDGFAVGYFETEDDFQSACARMQAHEVNSRWQAAMAKYTPTSTSPIEGAKELQHYFYLGVDMEDTQHTPGPVVVKKSKWCMAVAWPAFAAATGVGLVCGF